jgi:hypothetical protein
MHFVYDINLEFSPEGRKSGGFPQVAYIIYPGIGSGVYFYDVRELIFLKLLAISALETRLRRNGFPRRLSDIQTIGRFGKNPGYCGFSRSAWSGEQISLSDPVVSYGVGKRSDNMLLPDDL